jgi:hypothetical protein
MAIHKPWDRPFFVLGGSVMKNGFSLNLAEGQFGIFDVTKQTQRGSVAVESFKGGPINQFPRGEASYELKLGHNGPGSIPGVRSVSDKKYSSFPFHIKDVLDVRVSVPKRKDQSVDELIIGYNGIDPTTSIQLIPGDEKELYVELSGKALEYIGAPEGILGLTVPLSAPALLPDQCSPVQDLCAPVDMLPIILGAVDYIRDYDVMGVPFETFADVTPIIELSGLTRTGTTTSTLFTLQVCDTGDAGALALVQQQYGDLQVIRVSRKGPISTYQVAKTGTTTTPATAPAAFTQTIPSIMKGCESCPAGYTELPGGLLYAVALEDDGVDKTSVIQALPGAVAGTAKKADGQEFGVGFYTVVTDNALTDAEITTFMTANPTAIVEFVNDILPICENGTVTTATWATGSTVTASTQSYTIDLPDNECGQSRLAELQVAFPNLVITLADSTKSTRTVTLTGTSGTANIVVGGVNYLATFATNLTTTANNFVSTHGAAINTATGATVTASNGVITFTDTTVGFPTLSVANVTTNLAGTVGTITAIPVTGGCQRRYRTVVPTNFLGTECSEIFVDLYRSEAPASFDGHKWKEDFTQVSGVGGFYGIRLKGKKFKLASGECLRDMIGYTEDSVKIQASGGYIRDFNLGVNFARNIKDTPFNVEYLTQWKPRTHVLGNMLDEEKVSRAFFSGMHIDYNYMGRILTGNESNILDLDAQFVDYAITIRRRNFSQGLSSVKDEYIDYHINVELGRHQDVEDLVNALAAGAGLPGVQAFGNA